jgi:ribose 5-phosphate isomerase B
MRIALAADHAGFKFKEHLRQRLEELGHEITDYGTNSEESVDYPLFIRPAAEAVAEGKAELGIVIGGSGNGEAMVANKVKSVRCAVCWNTESARFGKEHNNANVIALGQRLVSEDMARMIVDTWLGTRFAGGRHLRRIEEIEQ